MAAIRKVIEKISKPEQRRAYSTQPENRTLHSRILDLNGHLSLPEEELEQIITSLIEETRLLDADENPAYYKQVLDAWYYRPKKILNLVRKIEPELLNPKSIVASRDMIRNEDLPTEAASTPGVSKAIPTTQENEREHGLFNKIGNAAKDIVEIINYGNASNKGYYGSCGGFGVENAHGLFGRRDETGQSIWDDFLCRQKDRENERASENRIFKNARHILEDKVTYEADRGTVVIKPFYVRGAKENIDASVYDTEGTRVEQ